MIEFISQVKRELGIEESAARSATGGLLKILQQNSDKSDFSSLLSKLPGAAAMLQEAPAAAEAMGSGGGLGGLMKSASSLLGGKLGGGLGALAGLQATGLDVEDIPRFASQFLGFAKSEAGEGVLRSVLKNLPELRKLL